MSRLFSYNGHLLLYIQTMRICLFQGSQMIDNPILGHAVVMMVLFRLIYLAIQEKFTIAGGPGHGSWLPLRLLPSGYTHFMLPLMLAFSGSAILFAIQERMVDGT